MHEVLVNRLEGLSLPGKSVARLTDRPDMTLHVCSGRIPVTPYLELCMAEKTPPGCAEAGADVR